MYHHTREEAIVECLVRLAAECLHLSALCIADKCLSYSLELVRLKRREEVVKEEKEEDGGQYCQTSLLSMDKLLINLEIFPTCINFVHGETNNYNACMYTYFYET